MKSPDKNETINVRKVPNRLSSTKNLYIGSSAIHELLALG